MQYILAALLALQVCGSEVMEVGGGEGKWGWVEMGNRALFQHRFVGITSPFSEVYTLCGNF